MKKLLLVVPLILITAACDTPSQTIAAGAVAGAAIDDNNRIRGAATGAAVGALAGAAIEASNNPQCTYRNTRTGETYRADCP